LSEINSGKSMRPEKLGVAIVSSGPTTLGVLLKLWISTRGDLDRRLHSVFKKRADLHELIHDTP